jgi:hypothetical protein
MKNKKQSVSHCFRQKFNGIDLYNLKLTNMKIQLKTGVMLLGVSFFILMGCKKEKQNPDLPITIAQTSTMAHEDMGYMETGTFTISGGIQTSGTFEMGVKFVADSFYCTNKLIAPEGTFTTDMKCSATNNTGTWKILSGTGRYNQLNGGGTLVMTYPTGVVGIETLSGTVRLRRQ